MAILYGQEETDNEVRRFVNEYVSKVKAFRHDRYHSIRLCCTNQFKAEFPLTPDGFMA